MHLEAYVSERLLFFPSMMQSLFYKWHQKRHGAVWLLYTAPSFTTVYPVNLFRCEQFRVANFLLYKLPHEVCER